MPNVSIIVPVYNASKTLAMTLGNLVHQTLSDYELILVNDASTDDSLSILLDAEAQFSDRILVVNLEENHGPGGARNIGLSYARGEYIGFCDSDDIVSTQMYEKLYEKAKEGDYDLVDCGYYNEATDVAIVHTSDDLTGDYEKVPQKEQQRRRSQLIAGGGYFWSKLFKKSFLDSLGLSFREHCILEDCETLLWIFANVSTVANVKEILYNYKNNPHSISKINEVDRYYENATNAVVAIYEQLTKAKDYEGIQEAVEYSIVNLLILAAKVCVNFQNFLPKGEKEARLTQLKEMYETMVFLPIAKNHYIQDKIAGEDLALWMQVVSTKP